MIISSSSSITENKQYLNKASHQMLRGWPITPATRNTARGICMVRPVKLSTPTSKSHVWVGLISGSCE